MTGPRESVIGVERDLAVRRFLTQTPVKFETAQGDPWLNAVLIDASGDGKATSIEQLLLPSDA
jgi:calcineurin-like phosphoesterase